MVGGHRLDARRVAGETQGTRPRLDDIVVSMSALRKLDPGEVSQWLDRHAQWLVADNEAVTLEATSTWCPAVAVLLAALRAARRYAGRETRLSEDVLDRVETLSPINDLRSARQAAEAAADELERTLPDAAHSVVRATRFLFEELGANIVQHSGSPETGFGTLHASPGENGGRFQMAFCDAGVGFLASLTRHDEFAGRVADDADALQLAVEKGLSSVGGRTNMGMGLGLMLDLSDRLGADLWIVSGSAMWQRKSAARGHRVSSVRTVPAYQGAWICFDGPGYPAAG